MTPFPIIERDVWVLIDLAHICYFTAEGIKMSSKITHSRKTAKGVFPI